MAPIASKQPKTETGHRPCVLVVDDEPMLIDVVEELLGNSVRCELIKAGTVREARRILATKPVELLLTDLHLPDGDGMSLIPALRNRHPLSSAIVITGDPTLDGAVNAIRHGAVDFLAKPFRPEQLTERVKKVLSVQSIMAKNEARLDRLRHAVKKLNEARRIVTKKVDLLCNDLVTAYGELSKELDHVRTGESFRQLLASAADLEQMLCHTMDWLLRQLGYANVAIWLASDQEFQLGAYMKYTVAGEGPVVDSMKDGLLPLVMRENIVRLEGETLHDALTPTEVEHLGKETVIAAHCTYLGESLAAIVMFRDPAKPFTDDDEETLKIIAPLFGVALASIVRNTQQPEGGGEGENGFFADDEERREDRSEADWWKRGDSPPF